jgi:hypothetical protein
MPCSAAIRRIHLSDFIDICLSQPCIPGRTGKTQRTRQEQVDTLRSITHPAMTTG